MARKPLAPTSGPSVVAKKLEARSVCTIKPDDPIWQVEGSIPENFEYNREIEIKGCIFRLQPPEGADPKRLKKLLENDGAAAVRVVQARRSRTVAKQVEFKATRGGREVVMEMAAESHFEDKAALIEVLEEALSRAGL